MAGDFNVVGMKKTNFMKEAFKLTAALDESIAMFRKWGNLDKFWTKMQIKSLELVSDLKEISDHSLICVKLRINDNTSRKLSYK